MIVQWTAAVLIAVGSFFSLIAAIGILRMPDVYMRIQASTKATTLGVSSIIVAAALMLDAPDAGARAMLIVALLLLTAPVAAHMIGRAAYADGVPLWSATETDEMQEDLVDEGAM